MNPGPRPGIPTATSANRTGWGLFIAEIWVLFSAWCSLCSWGLSICGRLDAAGYSVSFLIGFVLLLLWIKRAGMPPLPATPWKRALTLWHKRFRPAGTGLPFLFLIAALLTLAGGALYAPANYDALTYRLPRVFHWLAEGRWHWIDTPVTRMNYSGAGFEWLMTPLFVFTRSDRFLFLLNFLPWLLLPGAIFACFREMGVRPRVAWYWMWVFPLGQCYLLQAGSIGNDSYAALYILLSVCLALRAGRSGRAGELWIAAIAAALCTGSKAANLPLLLPFVIAAWPARRLIAAHKTAFLPIALICLAVSFLPLAILNHVNSGSWTGDPTNFGQMELRNPVAAFTGNALQLAIHNFEPPVLASALNGAIGRLSRAHFMQALMRAYPRLTLQTGPFPGEEGAGAGIGISLLFLISLAAWRWKPRGGTPVPARAAEKATGYRIALGAWIALAVYMAKIGSEAAPRLVAAYYPLCFALALLHPGNAALLNRKWWRITAALAALSVFPGFILSPCRPLWPATTILRALAARHPQSPFIQRMNTAYGVYSLRPRLFAPVIRDIPSGENVIAFLGTYDDPTASLWMPFGARRVVEFFPGNESRIFSRFQHDGKILLIASRTGIDMYYGKTPEAWISGRGARILAQESFIVKIQRGAPENWYVLELKAPGDAGKVETRPMEESGSDSGK